ncbi:MAG: helix-turn-helix transcriptional regulator [Chloroflexota bacterium]
MEKPIAKAQREARELPYDPEPFIQRLKGLLEKHNESYREAGLDSGLDHQAIRRILAGQRPSMVNCILLADHFGVNINEFLELAGWPTLKTFEVQGIDSAKLPPEAVEVALALAKITNPGTRKEVSQAILILVKRYFDE